MAVLLKEIHYLIISLKSIQRERKGTDCFASLALVLQAQALAMTVGFFFSINRKAK
jgi:hypothetical protein